MNTPAIEPLHPDFGARITGIDLSGPLDTATLGTVRAAIDRHSLLHFPGQSLNDTSQLSLTRQLGQPEIEHVRFGRDGTIDYFGTIGNVMEDGTVLGNEHEMMRFGRGNEMWHSDSSFRAVPTMVTITYAHEVPDEGGETRFVSARAAYSRLSEEMRARLEPLIVVHDYVYSRSKVAPVKPSHAASLPPVEQRLVRINPGTGEKNYYVGSHARSVVGWTEQESRDLLDDLLARATRPRDIHSHRWTPGDLVIWDNRCLLHRGTPFDADCYRRRMRQTRVSGAGPTRDE